MSKRYERLYNQLADLTSKSPNITAQIATINSALYYKVKNIFWIGVYFLKNNKLVVGAYQGPLACQILMPPKGVCWASINQNEVIYVPDVNKFPNHIACDSRSKSELVIPLRKNNDPIGVLDIDSDNLNAFKEEDIKGLVKIASLIDTNLPLF